MTRDATAPAIPATADQLDAAILELLRQAPDESAWWAELRECLPESTYWQRVESLTRLVVTGEVNSVKVSGRNYVSLALTLPVRRPRRPAA
jgi:hypothetical protein